MEKISKEKQEVNAETLEKELTELKAAADDLHNKCAQITTELEELNREIAKQKEANLAFENQVAAARESLPVIECVI